MYDPIAFSIGSLDVHWYGLIMGTAFLVGTYLARYNAKRSGIDPDHILNMVVWIIPAAIVCARLYYVAFEWNTYKENLLDIFKVWNGGLAIHGGLIGGFIAGALYIKKYNLPFLTLADAMMPSVILGQAIGRWGNFMNQEAHGDVASAAFMSHFPAFIREQMFIQGQYYHPTFLYESLWNILVLALLLLMLYQFKKFDGQILGSYLILYSFGRFFIEGMRTDSLYLGPLRIAQVMSLVLMAAGFIVLVYCYRRQKKIGSKQKDSM
ncbi:prolipoprotein diacylglyceryl transferase [Brevibacillus halotolerans]|uniref:prolipoprotein diacylglyceryl transferase n=1 Tax=Brevibacillus TaxID=55080 RepID=UPI00215CA600|nr:MULTISPECIES: prolipoprotein diacylglyceryl transferase [Brevibacillus]MCR8962363.1 prolipoprotein diacylglyceryl transferase [Brevibacillus laterosporus]MCZ0834518.1 prolipoprotein diacylglyceryl transferase [Brevibacillus halotolerans]